jgi:O-antigen/teichoic acid export membrane protein
LSFVIPALSYPFHLTLPTVVALLVASQATVASAYLAVCFRLFPVLRTRVRLDVASLQRMIAYGGWISLTNVISPILVYLDRFFIGSFLSMTAVTFYSAPYEMVTRLRVFATAICTTLFPEFSSSPEAVREGRLEMLFARGVKYVLVAVGVLVVMLYFAGDVLLDKWLGRDFAEHSIWVFRILAVGVLVNALAALPFNLLQGIGKPDVPAKFQMLELPLYVVLLYFLVRHFGITGAAVAWTARVALDAGLLFSRALAEYPRIRPMLGVTGAARALLMLVVLFGALLGMDALPLGLAGKLGVMAVGLAGTGVFVWYQVVDDVERGLVVSLWRRRLAHREVGG